MRQMTMIMMKKTLKIFPNLFKGIKRIKNYSTMRHFFMNRIMLLTTTATMMMIRIQVCHRRRQLVAFLPLR